MAAHACNRSAERGINVQLKRPALMKGSLRTASSWSQSATRKNCIPSSAELVRDQLSGLSAGCSSLPFAPSTSTRRIEDKVDILQNAKELVHAFGLERANVAILSAVEIVQPKNKPTLDVAALCKRADHCLCKTAEHRSILDRQLATKMPSPRKLARQGHRLAGCRSAGYFRRARYRSRQRAGEAARISAEAQIAGVVLGACVPILASRAGKMLAWPAHVRAAGAPQDGGEVLTYAILVLNVGSSSIKFSLFPGEQRPTRRDRFCEGECADLEHRVHFTAKDGAGAPLLDEFLNQGATHEDALAALLRWIGSSVPAAPSARGGASRRTWRRTL